MLRALIVEDDPSFRYAFKRVLHERLPCIAIEEVGNGEEALQRIKEAPPDFIFVDMRLGGMDGLELVQKIKKDSPFTRIAMLTGYDLPKYVRRQPRMDKWR